MKKIHIKSSRKGLKYAQIMDIRVLSTQIDEVLTRVDYKVAHNSKFYIVTPNPELVLMAQRHEMLKKSLNSSDLPVPDGIGLAQVAKFDSLWMPSEKLFRFIVGFFQGIVVGGATLFNKNWLISELAPIKGRTLFEHLIGQSYKKKWKVFLLGGAGKEAELSGTKLRSKYKGLNIMTDSGPQLNDLAMPATEFDKKLEKDVIDKINRFKPRLLFVAFRNPKQEVWIYKNMRKLSVTGAMAVGGTFRYFSGMSKLPPPWMENLGLEWVWRLISEPYRIRRIFNAFPIFPLRVYMHKVMK